MELPYNAEILHIIELINIGKGLIPTLNDSNLLAIKEPSEKTVPSMSEIIQASNSNGFWDNYFSVYQNSSRAGFSINNYNYSDFYQFPVLELGIFNYYGNGLARGFSFFYDKTIFNDTQQKGIEYESMDPLYATLNTLATRGFVLKTRYKHITDYNTEEGVYNVTEEDLGKTLIVSAPIPISIKLEDISEFNFEVFNNSQFPVTISSPDPLVSFYSKANSNTINIKKQGLVKVFNGSFNHFYQVAGDIDNTINNTTTTALNNSQLNTAYPSAETGFKVPCLNIASGALIYEKTANGWIQYAIQTVS
ncbi:hypothetical protein LPB248_05565 [Flavobacterium sp. LPB0248]|uniref:hypothetical protein n=1 Tax=Flavobacterium sp. LPB0248 TaxID=2614441 RepID=UPI0015A64A9E|nr:hypothetical protein [Flavobacterium sp. LPB0248]QLC65778.1 hypothetical protein LPB248_05565 [Flavobacterium sp. LPB0248]